MGLKLEQVVPWGRSLTEYIAMFDLSEADLQRQILDCGGGPASFNAEMTQHGYSVVACDPLYQFSVAEIRHRIAETYTNILKQLEANQQGYLWRELASPQQLGQVRMAAMQTFLNDLPIGLQQRRYQVGALPQLPFGFGQFDLALCSHLLFTYSDHFSLDFHLNSIRELCRVAAEVRIFPLLTLGGELSPFLRSTIDTLRAEGYEAQIRPVPYEFQSGGNQQLQVRCR